MLGLAGPVLPRAQCGHRLQVFQERGASLPAQVGKSLLCCSLTSAFDWINWSMIFGPPGKVCVGQWR